MANEAKFKKGDKVKLDGKPAEFHVAGVDFLKKDKEDEDAEPFYSLEAFGGSYAENRLEKVEG